MATNLKRRRQHRHLGIPPPQPVLPMELRAVAAINAVHRVQAKRHISRSDPGDDQREARIGIKLPATIKKTIDCDLHRNETHSSFCDAKSCFVIFLMSLYSLGFVAEPAIPSHLHHVACHQPLTVRSKCRQRSLNLKAAHCIMDFLDP